MRRLRISCLLVAVSIATIAPTTSAGSVSPPDAARFLAQATLGATWEEIERAAELGPETWLDEQFARPIGLHQPQLDQRAQFGLEIGREHRRWSWWQQVMQGPDPLRQRVALALSEHFVVSDNLGQIGDNPRGLANYYDMLLRHSFGNYRDLLVDVTLHPIMGVYLSHLRNQRSSGGRFPDENYAREIMQLFSIGLFQLNPDGSLVIDGTGEPIPTYDNDDITEFAKIFTGLSFDSPAGDFGEGLPNWTEPMRMYDAMHEPGPKFLLRGKYVPPGRTGMQDVLEAIDNLFHHPNVGPFVGRRLIQRLVTSNPSAEYLQRVSAAFADDGHGVRGDMQAVIRAILLDPEARERPDTSQDGRGMLRESYLRRVHLARAFDAANLAFSYPISDQGTMDAFAERPLSSPTVFNFFLPDHRPIGPINDAGLVSPEFQIINAVTAISSANSLRRQVDGVMNNDSDESLEVRLDLSDEIAIAADSRALVDRLDLLLMYGDMSVPMRQVLLHALDRLAEPEDRVKLAIHLISMSPEYCALK
ncbi:MAG: DUF1800 domain-containing protein [bacterium]|nr:DUF1800 domain-containing protein [bacterium]